MRISTADRYDSAIAILQQRQVELSQVQQQVVSGKRIAVPSDDPAGAARAERAYEAQQRITALQRSIAASRNTTSLAESGLGSAIDLLQSARETIVQAGDGSNDANARQALAAQLRQVRAQLLTIANQSDGNGGYVFAGQGSQSPPLVDGPGGVQYVGTAGQTTLSSQQALPAGVDGKAAWLSARSGNGVFVTAAAAGNGGQAWIDAGGVADPSALTGHTYTIQFSVAGGATTYSVLDNGAPTAVTGAAYTSGAAITVAGQSVHITGAPANGDAFTLAPSTNTLDPFAALNSAIAAIGNPSANPGQISQAVSSGLRDIDAVMSQMQSARSAAGSALNQLDQAQSISQNNMLAAQTAQSGAEDVDMVQALSSFKNQQTSYQAALQSYAMVQQLSLFNYLK